MATRYKLSKDQLERVVENFVMEAASAKATVKNHIPSQGSEAKKHVKNKISGKIVDKSEGMPSVTPMKKKLSHAPESKKFVSNSKMTHSNKAKVVKENEERAKTLDTNDVWNMIKGNISKASLESGNVDHMSGNEDMAAQKLGSEAKEKPKEFLNKRLVPVLRKAVKELGAENPDGTVNLEVLTNKSLKQKLIGLVIKGLGLSTAVGGILTTAITWLLKNSSIDLSDTTATNFALGGMAALILGGIIASFGITPSDRGKSGETAAKYISKQQ